MWNNIFTFVLISFMFYTSTLSKVIESTEKNDSKDLETETNTELIPTKTTPREFSIFENDTVTSAQEVTIFPNEEGIHFFAPYNEVVKADSIEDTTTDTGDIKTTIETTRAWIPEFSSKSRKSEVISNVPVKIKRIIKKCPKYKHNDVNFNLDDMAKTWQLIYSDSPDGLQCFKIHIKKLSQGEKDEYKVSYGNFSGKVDWDTCNLEIKSSTKMEWRHFLHADDDDNEGVMDNVIIFHENPEDRAEDEQPYSLKDEVPDQWQIYRNILLMRDCETGVILIFSSVAPERARSDLKKAWKKFGEEIKDVKLSCVNYQLNSTAIEEESSSEAVGDLVERLSDDDY